MCSALQARSIRILKALQSPKWKAGSFWILFPDYQALLEQWSTSGEVPSAKKTIISRPICYASERVREVGGLIYVRVASSTSLSCSPKFSTSYNCMILSFLDFDIFMQSLIEGLHKLVDSLLSRYTCSRSIRPITAVSLRKKDLKFSDCNVSDLALSIPKFSKITWDNLEWSTRGTLNNNKKKTQAVIMPTLPSIRELLHGALPDPIYANQDSQMDTKQKSTTISRVSSVDQLCLNPPQVRTAFAQSEGRDFRSDRSDISSRTNLLSQAPSPEYLTSMSPVWRCVEQSDTLYWKPLQHHLDPSRYPGANSSSSCSSHALGNKDLEEMLRNVRTQPGPTSDLDLGAIRHSVSEVLSGTLRPAHAQGWYQPSHEGNKFCKKLEDRIHGMNMNELVASFFKRDASRATYGDRVVIPRRPHDKKQKSESPNFEGELALEVRSGKKPHAVLEQERRERHREFQNQSCSRSPDIAAECGGEHADESKEARRQRAKGPGKDEQLCTAIYSQELSGRVVQSEHDGRTRAEKVAWLLLELLEAVLLRQKHDDTDSPRRNSYGSTQSSSLGVGRASRKRTLDKVNREEIRSQEGTSHISESNSDYDRSQSTASSPWKRYRTHYHFHGSSSTLQSLPPSPAPSIEEVEGRSPSDQTSRNGYKVTM